MKRLAWAVVLVGIAAARNASADTNVSGTISADTTWTLANSPYVVTGNVLVEKNGAPAPVLTIQPGVTVKFNSGTSLSVGQSYPGRLNAVGTSGQPITFTANTGTPTAGFWGGIRFLAYTAAGSQLGYATVSYGGVTNSAGGITVTNSSPALSNVTLQSSADSGLRITGASAAPTISSTTISGSALNGVYLATPATATLQTVTLQSNGAYAISQDAKVTLASVSALTATGNVNNSIEIRGSTVDAATTWRRTGLPYVVTGSDVLVQKNGTPVPILTIEPGVTVKFNSGRSLYIGQSYPGSLNAVGTSGQPITFTANTATPTAGFWGGIRFLPYTAAGSQLSYATVSYGGLTNNYGGVTVTNSSPTLSNVTIQASADSGLRITGTAAPAISSSTISGSALNGVYLATPATATLQTVSLQSNGAYAISQDAKVTLASVSALTATGNVNNAIEIRGYTVDAATTWRNPGLPYVVTGSDVLVQKNGLPVPTLTIEAGVTVKFNSGRSLYIGQSYSGSLNAVGTSGLPITFTANTATPTAGFWGGIRFLAYTAAGSQLSYATVSYGGLTNNYGGVTATSSSPALSNVTIQSSADSGLRITGAAAAPTISSTTISGSALNGVYLATPATATLQTVTLQSNGAYAISQDAKVTLASVSALTATGNVNNSIEIRGSTVDAATTWRSTGLPYVVTGADVLVQKNGTPVPTLTIAPGVTVKFNSGRSLYIGQSYSGSLNAVGTSSLPITFTANTATPTAGFWGGIRFLAYTAAGSQLSYATVSYGGVTNSAGGITVTSSSPALSNVTIQSSADSGLRITGTAAPTISSSTISGSALNGIYLAAPATVTLQTVSLQSNGAYAISQDAKVTLANVSALTATGNVNNSIEIRGSTVDAATTWRSTGLPYVVTGADVFVQKNGAPVPTLTIEAGVTVKFNSGRSLYIGQSYPGSLNAVGTSGLPITFTANTGTPTAGFWGGIRFLAYTAAGSQLSYATVSYGGVTNSAGGITVTNSSPALSNVTLQSNSDSGLRVSGGSPTILNCAFLSNSAGLKNTIPATPVNAGLNYWAASNGPSGSGPGSGQSVSTGVKFEPWLTSSPSTPQYATNFTQSYRSFNPNVGVNSLFSFGTTLAGNWTLKILNTGGAVIRNITGSGTTGSAAWDGKNDAGILQGNGSYSYQLESVTGGGQTASPARGVSIIDTSLQASISTPSVSQAFFSPNADGVKDSTILTASVAPSDASWLVNVRNSSNTIVRTYSGAVPPLSLTWDGRNGSAVVQPDGSYTFELIATYGTTTATASAPTVLDNTVPVAIISAPAPSQFVSNVFQNGSTSFAVYGTASDANIQSWTLDYGAGSAPTSWSFIQSGTSSYTNALLKSWLTDALTTGPYVVRLRTWDNAGNLAATTVPITAGNFKVTQGAAQQINAATGETITYTSVVPVTLTETLTIRNEAGQTVRTLFNGSRAAGTYLDSWDGKGPSGQTLPSGGYFVTASTVAGSSSMTWDQSTQYMAEQNNGAGVMQSGGFDPLNNQPLTVTYSLTKPSRVSMFLRSDGAETIDSCLPPQYCVFYNRYQESGAYTEHWAGVDGTGAPWGVYPTSVLVVSRRDLFPKNAVVVLGTKATLSNLVMTPPRVDSGGTLGVVFDLATYQNASSNLTLTFLNQTSLSILRTITVSGQAPGHVVVNWDTRADNGMLVAPGRYVITISGQDAIGNQIFGQSLASVFVR